MNDKSNLALFDAISPVVWRLPRMLRYPVLEVTATVEPFENGRGFSLRVQHAGKPRQGQQH